MSTPKVPVWGDGPLGRKISRANNGFYEPIWYVYDTRTQLTRPEATFYSYEVAQKFVDVFYGKCESIVVTRQKLHG
jgi:hypothetical protein